MLDLSQQAGIFQAIKSVASSDPDQAVQDAADEVAELLENSRQVAMMDRALLVFNDTSKTTNARIRALSHLRRLLLKSNAQA